MRNFMLVFSLCLFAAPAQSQGDPALIGQRVWVRAPDGSGRLDAGVKGTLEGITGDSLQVRLAGGGPAVSVGLSAQTQVNVFTGRRSSAGRGAAIGGGIGALAGVVIGLAAGEDCSSSDWICFDRSELAAAGAVAFGGAGLVIGLIAGALSHHDTWAPAGLSQTVRPAITTNPYGIGLGFSILF